MILERAGVMAGLVLVGVLGGCGDRGIDSTEASLPPRTALAHPVETDPTAGASATGVLYDGNWEIDDTGWFLSDRDLPRLWSDATSSNGLLEEGGPHSLWVMTPGLYGAYPARLTSFDSEPPEPQQCEDLVEAPLRVGESGAFAFGTFESASDPFKVGAGDFRVRLCATGLDEAVGEPEFDGNDLHVSASRFEFQIWPSPVRPGEVVKVGSAFAREQHARVGATS